MRIAWLLPLKHGGIVGATASAVLPEHSDGSKAESQKSSNTLNLKGKLAPAVGIEPTTN
jgi:hypothetical protein